MGSFYVNCAITNTSILDEDKTTIQLLLPTTDREPSIGNIFVEGFLKIVNTNGLNEALKFWNSYTSQWARDHECSEKGVKVSMNPLFQKWIPFGPAIDCIYKDYGEVIPVNTEENLKRIEILESILTIPFETIISIATEENACYTNDIKSKPDFLQKLFKRLSICYYNTNVYKLIVNDSYNDNFYENDLLKTKSNFLTTISDLIKNINRVSSDFKIDYDNLLYIRHMNPEDLMIYLASLYREKSDISWIGDHVNLVYAFSTLRIIFDRSNYGGQESNIEFVKKCLNVIENDKFMSGEELMKASIIINVSKNQKLSFSDFMEILNNSNHIDDNLISVNGNLKTVNEWRKLTPHEIQIHLEYLCCSNGEIEPCNCDCH